MKSSASEPGLTDAVPVEWRKRVKQSAHYTRPDLRNKVHLKN